MVVNAVKRISFRKNVTNIQMYIAHNIITQNRYKRINVNKVDY